MRHEFVAFACVTRSASAMSLRFPSSSLLSCLGVTDRASSRSVPLRSSSVCCVPPQDRGGRQLIYDLCSQHRNCNFLGYAVKKILSAGAVMFCRALSRTDGVYIVRALARV